MNVTHMCLRLRDLREVPEIGWETIVIVTRSSPPLLEDGRYDLAAGVEVEHADWYFDVLLGDPGELAKKLGEFLTDNAVHRNGADYKVTHFEMLLVVSVLCSFGASGRGIGSDAVGRGEVGAVQVLVVIVVVLVVVRVGDDHGVVVVVVSRLRSFAVSCTRLDVVVGCLVDDCDVNHGGGGFSAHSFRDNLDTLVTAS